MDDFSKVTVTTRGERSGALGRPLNVRLRYLQHMTVHELTSRLLRLPRDAEVLAFEPGCEQYFQREVDDVEWVGRRVYLHLGACLDDFLDRDSSRN